MLSPEGIIVSWNAGAQRSKGYRADEIIGRHFRTFYPPELQEARHPEYELERALNDGHYSEEGWRIRKDGSTVLGARAHHGSVRRRPGSTSGSPRSPATSRPTARLRRPCGRARSDFGSWWRPSATTRSSCSTRRARRELEHRRPAQHGLHEPRDHRPALPRLLPAREPGRAHHRSASWRSRCSEGRYEEEGWRVRKDGSRYWANVVITAVFNDVGEHIGFAKVTRDRTEKRRAEQEREQTTDRARRARTSASRQAAADQSQFLAVTAHELRTPTAVLGGSAGTLSRHWEELGERGAGRAAGGHDGQRRPARPTAQRPADSLQARRRRPAISARRRSRSGRWSTPPPRRRTRLAQVLEIVVEPGRRRRDPGRPRPHQPGDRQPRRQRRRARRCRR